MMITIRAMSLAIAVLARSLDNAYADDFVKGLKAYEAKDFAQARKIIQKLAETGDARAQYRFGAMYDYGAGIAADHTTALTWYRKSAIKGNIDAQYALGEALLTGAGQNGNPVEAIGWFRKAAAQGHLQAFMMLAISYRDGVGVPADIVMAHVFANIDTAQMGKIDLVERGKIAKELATILTEQQRAESKELQLLGMTRLSRLPASSKTGQK
jgi:TPR repeat protein